MSELDLLYTDVEEDLRASVRALLSDRCGPAAVTAMYDGDRSIVGGLWKALAVELGLAGLLVPEARGGQGATAREAAVVLEELGRAAAPVPFLTSAVIATTLLLETEADLLAEVAAGERTAAIAVPWSTAPDGAIRTVHLDGDRLTGVIPSVAGALEADVLLVPVATAHGLAVYSVATADVSVTPVVSLDMTRQLADIALDGVDGTLLLVGNGTGSGTDASTGTGAAADAEPALRRALDAGAALLASEQLGVARWCLETTVAYLRERRQFGRVVGGFQALKHRLADLYTGVESAAAAARYAAATLTAGDPDTPLAASLAQAYCAELAVLAAEEAVQLHAGIGMTWEHPVHLYLKRAKADQIALGTPGRHRTRLASLVELPC
jgi:alkylation response protein AidB-like acyl-CoA dehydrogenase